MLYHYITMTDSLHLTTVERSNFGRSNLQFATDLFYL